MVAPPKVRASPSKNLTSAPSSGRLGVSPRIGQIQTQTKNSVDKEKCVRMGDFVVFSSLEEDEQAFLASSSVQGEDSVVVTQTRTRKSVFEIMPIIHNTARKAFKKAQKTSANNPSELKKLRELAVKEAEQNEEMCNQMEGMEIKYGQIIQFAHAESGNRYLTGSNSEAALLEHSCAKVFLRPNSGKKCWFKLLPAGEYASVEGKTIPIGAEVCIVPANIDLMFTHRSSWTDEQGEYEANLSSVVTNWTVELFDTSGKKNLKAGAMLRLLHQKAGYLGSFARTRDTLALRDSLCFRYVPPSKRNKPTETTNSIWVIEMESSTGSVSYHSRVRFNLWGTNRYLAFTSDRSQIQATLMAKTKDNTLFLFHKYDRKDTGKLVSLNSFVTVQHLKTKYWLKGVPLLEDLKHWGVECSAKSNQSDVIRLTPVSQSQAGLIEYIQKRRKDLDAYVLRLRKKESLLKIGTPIIETLIDLIQWVTDPPPPREDPLIDVGKPMKERQRLLGSPGLLEVLVELIWRPFEKGYNSLGELEKNGQFRFQCELVYGVLTKTAKGRKKVCARLFKYLDVFSSQIGTGLAVYPLLEEIFRGSKDLCEIIAPSQLENFIDVMAGGADPGEGPPIFFETAPFLSPQHPRGSPRVGGRGGEEEGEGRGGKRMPRKFGSLVKAKNVRGVVRSGEFLDFLSGLCVSNGEAHPNNQDLICSRLLVTFREYFLETRVENDQVIISVDSAEGISLDQFLWTADRSLVKFYVSSLNLFHRLCFGRNSSSIREVRKSITGEGAMSGLMCKDLPFSLRTAYCSVLHHVYLDCHPYKHEKISTVFAVRNQGKERESGWGGEEDEGEESEEGGRRGLVEFEEPLRVSMFDREEEEEVDWLMFVGFFENLLSNVKIDSSYLSLFMLELLKLLRSLLSFEMYILPMKGELVTALMKALWVSLEGRGGEMTVSRPEPHDEEIVFAIKAEVCKIFQVTFLHDLHQRLKKVAQECQQSLHYEAIVAGQISSEREKILGERSKNQKLEAILCYLLRHDDEKLSGMAMQLLVSSRSHQLAAYETIAKKMRFLSSEEDLTTHDKVVEECIPYLNQARDSLVSCDLMEVRKKIIALVDMCIIQQKKKQMIPNEKNQELLAHLGAHQAVIRLVEAMPKSVFDSLFRRKHGGAAPKESIPNIMRSEMDILSVEQQENLKSVYTGCYVFLNKFCKNHSRNQTLLFPYLHIFISHLQLGIAADDTLISIFTDNETLCRKLPPHIIISVLGIIKDNPREAIRPLRFLQAVATPGGSANRTIQSLILKQIVGKANEYCPLLSPEMCGELIRQSNSENPKDQDLVNYYGEVTNVLSACAYGKSHAAEATCQNLLPLSAILETLNRTMSLNLRNAFARFLDEVWFHTEIFVPELVFIQSNPQLWIVFSMFSDQMMDFCDLLRGKRKDAKKSYIRRRGTFLQPQLAGATASTGALPPVPVGGPLPLDDMSEKNIGGWTRYLCDQVIPLLQHFYEKLFVREKAMRDQIEITGEIFDSCCSMLQTRLAHRERVNKIGQCLDALIKTGLIDSQRAKRSNDILTNKMKEMQKHRHMRNRHTTDLFQFTAKPLLQNAAKQMMDEAEIDATTLVSFRLAVRDVPAVFGPLVQLIPSHQTPDYAALLAGIIKDGSVENMELKLSCLRFLRYIAWDGCLEEIQSEDDWNDFKIRQDALASLDLVPASLALLGPAKDDEDVCTQALDLALVLTYKNKNVRDALMEHYFSISEEVVWLDLRTLIQNSIAHIRNQKASRPIEDHWDGTDEFQSSKTASRGDVSAPRRMSREEHKYLDKKGPIYMSGMELPSMGNNAGKALGELRAFAPEYHRDFYPSEPGKFPQLPYTRMLFRFMQSLCIDHDEKVQRYLHNQDDNFQNVDLVRESALYLRMIDDFANPDTLDDIQQCIVFMQDLAIGSRDNQVDLVAVGVCESLDLLLCKNILPLGVTEQEKEENMLIELELQLKVTELLLTLLEGNSETTIATTMISTLSFPTLLYHAQFLQQKEDKIDTSEAVKKRKMDLAKNTFRLIKMLGETDPANVPDEMRETLEQAFDLINSNSSRSAIGRIEIIAPDRSLQRLYFPVPPSCQPHQLDTGDLQAQFENFLTSGNVDWQSTTERVEALCRWFENLLINIEHEANTQSSIFVPWRWWLIYLALFLAFVLNVLVVAFADTDGDFPGDVELALRLSGIGELALALLILVAYGKKYGRPLHYQRWKDRYNKVYQKMSLEREEQDIPLDPPSVLFRDEQRDVYINSVLEFLHPKSAPPTAKFFLYSTWHFLIDFQIDGIFYQMSYIICVLLGILVHPFFYCFLLLDIVRISPALRTVLLTIYLIKWKLFFIGILIWILIWIFSLYVFLFIPEAFDPENGAYCDYPLQCVISLSHIGISLAGATIEFVNISPWEEIGSFMGIVIFDILFYIVIGMILFNIIFAVIVDKFGQLRDNRAAILSDLINRCFICSIEREVFQSVISERGHQGVGNNIFLDHITQDHRPWDYLFFFEYLKWKTDPMTSNEEHVLRQIKERRWLAFMPVGRAKIIEVADEGEEETIKDRFDILTKSLTSTSRLLNRLHNKMDAALASSSLGYEPEMERLTSDRSEDPLIGVDDDVVVVDDDDDDEVEVEYSDEAPLDFGSEQGSEESLF